MTPVSLESFHIGHYRFDRPDSCHFETIEPFKNAVEEPRISHPLALASDHSPKGRLRRLSGLCVLEDWYPNTSSTAVNGSDLLVLQPDRKETVASGGANCIDPSASVSFKPWSSDCQSNGPILVWRDPFYDVYIINPQYSEGCTFTLELEGGEGSETTWAGVFSDGTVTIRENFILNFEESGPHQFYTDALPKTTTFTILDENSITYASANDGYTVSITPSSPAAGVTVTWDAATFVCTISASANLQTSTIGEYKITSTVQGTNYDYYFNIADGCNSELFDFAIVSSYAWADGGDVRQIKTSSDLDIDSNLVLVENFTASYKYEYGEYFDTNVVYNMEEILASTWACSGLIGSLVETSGRETDSIITESITADGKIEIPYIPTDLQAIT